MAWLKEFSTDMVAAWEVVETFDHFKMSNIIGTYMLSEKFWVHLANFDKADAAKDFPVTAQGEATAESIPLAISLAALKAVGG